MLVYYSAVWSPPPIQAIPLVVGIQPAMGYEGRLYVGASALSSCRSLRHRSAHRRSAATKRLDHPPTCAMMVSGDWSPPQVPGMGVIDLLAGGRFMRSRVTLCAGIVLCLVSAVYSQGSTTWVAPNGGKWSLPANWAGGLLPSAQVKAFFTGPSDCVVDTADAAAWQIDLAGGPLKIVKGGTLTVVDWFILGYQAEDPARPSAATKEVRRLALYPASFRERSVVSFETPSSPPGGFEGGDDSADSRRRSPPSPGPPSRRYFRTILGF
jgi:hypothetical protein